MYGLTRDGYLNLLRQGGRIKGLSGGYQNGLNGYFWANSRARGWYYIR